MTVLFVMHQPTRKYLKRFGLAESLHSNIRRMNMLDYNEFVALQKAAGFVVTDGGSIQEECSYLNKPCLILRNVTERSNGLDKNAVLWNFDDSVAEGFLLNHRNGTPIDLSRFPHPSAEIVDALIGLKF
jgi:UDP-N-acetylglucosamine 2-epimerase (non-hydrolysing)